ncbi:MAG: hypothetical protein ACI90V_005199, partial [Bacillariaceae sp.]
MLSFATSTPKKENAEFAIILLFNIYIT